VLTVGEVDGVGEWFDILAPPLLATYHTRSA